MLQWMLSHQWLMTSGLEPLRLWHVPSAPVVTFLGVQSDPAPSSLLPPCLEMLGWCKSGNQIIIHIIFLDDSG